AIDRLEPTEDLEALVDAVRVAAGDAQARHRGITGAQLAASLGPFVRDTLHLPWRWVVDDLMARYEQLYWHFGRGTETELHYVVHINLAVPFEWPAGQTGDEARGRHDARIGAAQTAYRKAKRHNSGDNLERWGDWFYRARVKDPRGPGDSIHAIAREY